MLVMALQIVAMDVNADTVGVGDAGMYIDAGDTLANATALVPGNYLGYLDTSGDTNDYYLLHLLSGETISIVLDVPTDFNYDLSIYDESDNLVSSSTNGVSVDESITAAIDADGSWKIRVYYVSGSGDGEYGLNISLSAGYENFNLDVGAVNDDAVNSHIPGLSVLDSLQWADPSSGARVASANASFLLNIYEGTFQENAYYEVSVRYSSTEDVNVSVSMDDVWVQVATLPGKSTYWTYTFLLEPSYLSDYSDELLGMNVRLRFEDTVTVDSISAASVAWDSDFFGDIECNSGIMAESGWTVDGIIVNGSANAALIVNLPSTDSSYFLEFSILSECSGIAVQQWDGSSWVALGTLEAWGTVAVIQLNENEYYDVSSDAGMNIRIRFTSAVVNLTKVTLWTSQRITDVGVSGDTDTNSIPGISILDNEWSSFTTVDGRTARTTASTSANFYLNGVLSDTSYAISITYKSSAASVSIQQYLSPSSGYASLGTLTGDNAWHTSTFYTQVSEMYDHVTGAPLNILFQIYCSSGTVTVDSIAMCMDYDGDGISDAMESIRVTMSGIGTHTYDLNPFSADTDSDGLNDNVEITSYGTDPTDEDSDDDGLLDGSEKYTYSWTVDGFRMIPNGGKLTLTIGMPSISGQIDSMCLLIGITHPDQTEIKVEFGRITSYRWLIIPVFTMNTLKNSGTGSGANYYACINLFTISSPYTASDFSTGKTWYIYVSDTSSDADVGRLDYVKLQVNGTTDPLDSDSDNDGILDGEEVNFGTNGWMTNPRSSDSDGDGVSDYNEINGNTLCSHILDPTNTDTDDDGYNDNVDRYYGDAIIRITVLEYKSWEDINYGSTMNIFFVITYDGTSLSTGRLTATTGNMYYPSWIYDIDVPDTATSAPFVLSAVADDAGGLGDDIKLDVAASSPTEYSFTYSLSSSVSYYQTEGGRDWFDGDSDAYMKVSLQTRVADKAKVIVINGTGNDGDYGLEANSTGSYRYSADDQIYMINLDVSNASTHFQAGINTIILPRAIALQCELNYTLSNLGNMTSGDALYGASFYYMSGSSASSHVIAVINHDVNGAVAEAILQMLTHDHDDVRIGNNVTMSADNVYLLHLPNDVVSSIPTIIQNSGPGASPNYLDPLNVIADIVDMVFNFLVYVVTTLTLILQQLADIGLATLGDLSSAVASAVQTAVGKIVDTFTAFVEWATEEVLSLLGILFNPVIEFIQNLMDSYFSRIVAIESMMQQEIQEYGYVKNNTIVLMADSIMGELFRFLISIAIAMDIAIVALMMMTGGLAFLLATFVAIVMGYIISNVLSMSVGGSYEGAVGGSVTGAYTFAVNEFTDSEDNYTNEQECIAFSIVFSIMAIELSFLTFSFGLGFVAGLALSILSILLGYLSYEHDSFDLAVMGIACAVSSIIITLIDIANKKRADVTMIGLLSISFSGIAIWYSNEAM